jgi:hypothetical protein
LKDAIATYRHHISEEEIIYSTSSYLGQKWGFEIVITFEEVL